jgi:TolA-binding protein
MSIYKKLVCMCVALSLLVLGCSSAENRAAELYELAAFEQQQFNAEHALQLYDQILAEYPDTQAAQKAKAAREKLRAEAGKG